MASKGGHGPDFLAHLEELRGRHGGVFPRRGGGVYVADPYVAKEVLGNHTGHFKEHSDFFKTRGGTFGPRAAQVGIGRAARLLLHRHTQSRAGTLPALVRRHLVPSSTWPDAGNRLLFAHYRQVLLGDDASPQLRETVQALVERAVLAGARDRYTWLSRARFRARAMRVLTAELDARRAAGRAGAQDLPGVIAQAASAGTSSRELAEVFLSCLFAVAGSVGFLLGWSLYLLGTSGPGSQPAPAAWVVREALRLWPVAWLFSRTPAGPHELAGLRVTPADDVFVCSYLVHRDPGHWSDPNEFRPARWASVSGQEAFIPFGWGPHACTGAAVSMQIAEAVVDVITSAYRFDVSAPDSRPQVAAALAPPRFTLRLEGLPAAPEGR